MTPPESLLQRYQRELSARGFQADAAQTEALEHLQRLRSQLLQAEPRGWFSHWRRRRLGAEQALGGVYLWGAVGRGKTWLVDLFCSSLPPRMTRRLHFNRFMREVHQQLKQLRNQAEPLELLAQRLARQTRALCLDELFVSDIADAMILGTLFEALLRQGIALVLTSNAAPEQLYKDGLQRARFVPAIELLRQRLDVVELDGAVDYRLRQLQRRPIYLDSRAADTPQALGALYAALTTEQGETRTDLKLNGRSVRAERRCGEVVWFSFATLCESARSPEDYIQLAQEFRTLIVSDVPVFASAEQDDAARRFISLIDELYDQGVKLVVSAAAPANELYRGERLRASFERTTSRLIEMQSQDYLARPHRG